MVIQAIPPEAYQRAADLFAPLSFHLAVEAVLAGATPGRVWLDDLEQPHAGLMQVHHRFYLSGDAQTDQFASELGGLFAKEIFPHGRAAGEEAFSLYFSDGWENVIEADILMGVEPIAGGRQYYEYAGQALYDSIDHAEDLCLVEVNRALIEDGTLTNLESLVEEMQSERSSVDEFLSSSFGLCLRSQDQIVTWCLSEYNLGERCEVGIATEPAYRRRGLAALTGAAFLKLAQTHGIARIGWHCWTSNEGSWRTALKTGFQKKRDYSSYLVFFQPAIHFAVMGDSFLNQGRYGEALMQLERSIAEGNAPGWAYLNAACASARLEETDKAFRYLKAASLYGIDNARHLMEIDHLNSLHGLAAWKNFLQGLHSS